MMRRLCITSGSSDLAEPGSTRLQLRTAVSTRMRQMGAESKCSGLVEDPSGVLLEFLVPEPDLHPSIVTNSTSRTRSSHEPANPPADKPVSTWRCA